MDSWLWIRFAFGGFALGGLALHEIRTKRTYSRLREYAFLLSVAAMTIAYAVLHDRVTFSLSREYFTVLKGLILPLEGGFFPDVVWLASQAGWTAGLVVGMVFLVANNPDKTGVRPQLPYGALYRRLRIPILAALLAATVGALIGQGQADILRPLGLQQLERTGMVWGIHLGSYLGGIVGSGIAVVSIRRARSALTPVHRTEDCASDACSGAAGIV